MSNIWSKWWGCCVLLGGADQSQIGFCCGRCLLLLLPSWRCWGGGGGEWRWRSCGGGGRELWGLEILSSVENYYVSGKSWSVLMGDLNLQENCSEFFTGAKALYAKEPRWPMAFSLSPLSIDIWKWSPNFHRGSHKIKLFPLPSEWEKLCKKYTFDPFWSDIPFGNVYFALRQSARQNSV